MHAFLFGGIGCIAGKVGTNMFLKGEDACFEWLVHSGFLLQLAEHLDLLVGGMVVGLHRGYAFCNAFLHMSQDAYVLIRMETSTAKQDVSAMQNVYISKSLVPKRHLNQNQIAKSRNQV